MHDTRFGNRLRGMAWLVVVLGFATIARAGEPVSAVKLDRISSYSGGAATTINAGWEFETTADVEVVELGLWDTKGDGLDVDMPVKLWDIDGKELASVEVPKGVDAKLVDGFRYVKIEPVKLTKGGRYVIAAQYSPKDKEYVLGHGGGNISVAAPLKWVASRRSLKPELTVPERQKPDREGWPDLPGCFGPNLRIADSAVARDTRMYYRSRYLPQKQVYQLIVTPERADGAHRDDTYKTVSLYALSDGTLTQVMFDDLPLGTGEKAFATLAKEVKKVMEAKTDDPPLLRVASMSTVRNEDRQRAVNVVDSGEFDAAKPGRELKENEVGPLQAQVKQPEKNGKHVAADRYHDHGEYVEDRWTGLYWQKDGVESGKLNYQDAFDYANELELGKLKDWRVPTIEELSTIFPATHAPFTGTKYNPDECCGGMREFASYWTSELDLRNPDYAYLYHWYYAGGANNCYGSKNYVYVRCVHNPLKK